MQPILLQVVVVRVSRHVWSKIKLLKPKNKVQYTHGIWALNKWSLNRGGLLIRGFVLPCWVCMAVFWDFIGNGCPRARGGH